MLSVIMLSEIMLSGIMLSVFMLNAIMQECLWATHFGSAIAPGVVGVVKNLKTAEMGTNTLAYLRK